MQKIKQFLCGLFTHHSFSSVDTKGEYDNENNMFTITETCMRCGKVFQFTASGKTFGL